MAMLEYLPTSGRVLFRGEPTAGRHGRDLAAYRQAVQMIFQDPVRLAQSGAHHRLTI
jgi:peptide/nickel transport system ATP-binding protein